MKGKTKHDRAIRGWPEYQVWRDFAEFLETIPYSKPPEVLAKLRDIFVANNITREALELILRERYPSFVVLKRLKGE